MKRVTLLIVLCVLAFVLGACSSGGAGPASPTVPPIASVQPAATSTRVSSTPTTTASVGVGGVTPAAAGSGLVTIDRIKSSPDQFRDRLVRIRGVGIAVATFPLCPGYIGFDKRVMFFENVGGGPSIYAVNKLPAGVRPHYDSPQVFEGYVRVFSGEMGCPGQVKQETFPYLEVTGVVPGPSNLSATPSASSPSVPGPSPSPAQASSGTVVIDDPSFVKLTALANPGHRIWWATDFVLEVKAVDPTKPVEVSYLVTDSNGTPTTPTAGVEVRGNNFIAGWDSGKQYYFYTQVGSQAQPPYASNPQYFPLPHYRTCLMVLGRHDLMYAVFLRENDGKLTYQVLKGGPFNGLDVPGLAKVTWQDGFRFEVRSYGDPVEVGLWVNGRYQHDEVAGRAGPEFRQNPKYYYLDHYAGRPSLGMFLLMIARYEKLGLIVGNESEGQIGAVVLTGSHAWEKETVQDLAELTALIPRTPGVTPKVEVRATGGSPVEVSHFAFDNTCWQWEVNGRARPDYALNPQSFALKHYTPAFMMVSRYGRAGIFFYNENDGRVGVLPVGTAGVATQALSPSADNLVTIEEIQRLPERFKDRLVRIRGLGLDVATVPLCPGYVGFDKRVVFRDDAGRSIPVLADAPVLG